MERVAEIPWARIGAIRTKGDGMSMSKILRVNMSTLSVVIEEFKENYRLLGGRAFIAKYMLEEVKATCEPLGRHNPLIFTPGLLGGSKAFSSGRISIGGKSPLTGGIKESNGGGVVGLKLARAWLSSGDYRGSPQRCSELYP